AADQRERYAALVERDEEAAEAVVERVDVVEEPEDVGLAPGEVLSSDPDEERTLLEVEVGEEEPVARYRVASQPVDPLLDVARVEEGRGVREPRDVDLRQVAAEAAERGVLVRVLIRTPVVEALALEAILERVLEAARVDEPERRQQTHALVHEARQVVIVLELQEEAVLAKMPRSRDRIVERVVAVADGLRPDAHRVVGTEAETNLASVVEGQGERGACADQHRKRNQRPRQMPFHAPPLGCRHSATSDARHRSTALSGKPRLYKKARAKVSRTSRVKRDADARTAHPGTLTQERSPRPRLADRWGPDAIRLDAALRRGSVETSRWLVERLVGEVERAVVDPEKCAGPRVEPGLHRLLWIEVDGLHHRRG